MSKWLSVLLLSLAGAVSAASADVVQLKDHASITGTILAEKRDLIVIDLGYTVLTVPRRQVVRVSRAKAAASETPEAPVAAGGTASKTRIGLYTVDATPPPERPVRDLVNQLGSSVVQVRTPSGLGSGFIIDEDGFLITNFHVIEGESHITVEVYLQKAGQLERRNYKQVRIVAMNKFADLSLLKIEDKDAPKFTAVPLGNSEALVVGESVFAIGSPLGLERTVTEGIISTKTREIQGSLYLQTTAQINPGNSGGPLFNLRGEVVGVTNMKIVFGEGLGFAIPVDEVKYFLNNRDAYAYDNDNPNNPYRYLEPPSRAKQTNRDARN